jgi:hypothetical protein
VCLNIKEKVIKRRKVWADTTDEMDLTSVKVKHVLPLKNVMSPDGIRSWDLSHCKLPLYQLS